MVFIKGSTMLNRDVVSMGLVAFITGTVLLGSNAHAQNTQTQLLDMLQQYKNADPSVVLPYTKTQIAPVTAPQALPSPVQSSSPAPAMLTPPLKQPVVNAAPNGQKPGAIMIPEVKEDAIGSVSSSAAVSQPPPTRDELFRQLALTQQQSQQLRALREAFQRDSLPEITALKLKIATLQQLETNGNASKEELNTVRAEVKALLKPIEVRSEADLRSILTAKQLQVFDQWKQQQPQ